MAIIKATYTKSKKAAKATISYITSRPGKDGLKITRELFGHDGPLDRSQAYKIVEEVGKGTVFFRLVLSPDPKREDTKKDLHLWELTQNTMLYLEDRVNKEVRFVATEHNDHAPHRHVHVLALIQGRLTAKDLEALRLKATDAALSQRRERDLAREHSRGRMTQAAIAHKRTGTNSKAATDKPKHARGKRTQGRGDQAFQTCPRCGKQQGRHLSICVSCGLKLSRSSGKEASWER